MELAKLEGPYSTFEGSPSLRENFSIICGTLKMKIYQAVGTAALRRSNGARFNSLLVAPMPTASTSQILGNNEAFEPYTSNIYTSCIVW
jgi:ribonucleoside-diphosphate reductase alpha chain